MFAQTCAKPSSFIPISALIPDIEHEIHLQAEKFCKGKNSDVIVSKMLDTWNIIHCPTCHAKIDILETPMGLFSCPKCKGDI